MGEDDSLSTDYQTVPRVAGRQRPRARCFIPSSASVVGWGQEDGSAIVARDLSQSELRDRKCSGNKDMIVDNATRRCESVAKLRWCWFAPFYSCMFLLVAQNQAFKPTGLSPYGLPGQSGQ